MGECTPEDLKIGPIRQMRDGLGIVWIQGPLAAMMKVGRVGRIRLSWTVVKAELLRARPTQCFRCWHFGHVKSRCTSMIDRTGACFKCGRAGHLAKGCTATPVCVVCVDRGWEFTHRLGSGQCRARNETAFRNGARNITDQL